MKYCSKCYEMINEGDTCPVCGRKVKACEPQSSVKVTKVKGSLKSMLEPALIEKGIPFQYFNPEMDIYTQFNTKVKAETEYVLLVPFEFYSEAFDVCVGLGLADSDDKIILDESTQLKADGKNYDQRFEESTGTKRKVVQIIWIVIFIVAACLIIWGVEFAAEYFKGSMINSSMIKFLNLLNF